MIAAPWYLLAAGIVVLLVGSFLGAVRGPSADKTYIDPRMSDAEVAKRLKRSQGDPVSRFVVLSGLLMIMVSIVWRIARVFLKG
jgi:hypothetical protein